MKGIPQTIWLNLGEESDIEDAQYFSELHGKSITWSENRIYSGDVKYVREKIVKQRQKKQDEKDLKLLNEIISKIERKALVRMGVIDIIVDWKTELEQKLKKWWKIGLKYIKQE